MSFTYHFQVDATLVSNEFIDRYLAEANGEYVKVYLYLLRHKDEPMSSGKIADGLNHTEADIRRALAYWEKLGVISTGEALAAAKGTAASKNGTAEAASDQTAAASQNGTEDIRRVGRTGEVSATLAAGGAGAKTTRPVYSQDQVNRLQGDGEFAELLYIAQRYLNKIFTQRELEVFAYLYDGLHMSAELLEYLVEHCVQGGHTSIRYIETVAISWHEKGFATVEQAKAYASGFTKNSFSVMRAFGLTGRNPGEMEREMIERWFGEYGFTKEVVLEACNRTIEATHNPSFRYADRILSEWRKAGVHSLTDISVLDEKYKGQKNQKSQKNNRQPNNQFLNFEQRNTDYDSMVLNQVKDWIGEQ